jgi:uncharacterized protein YbcV (DUF1398 family)
MFTIEQIEEANSKVRSGADFPRLVQDLIRLGVKTSDVYVSDGHAEYFGENEAGIKSGANYSPLEIAETSDREKFKNYLKIHQQGQTDYPTFCRHSAETGVEKWKLDFEKMTCAYFDKSGRKLLTENIPQFS